MIEIFWTMLASQDRKRIREYIAEQNLMAAIEFDERIGYSVSSLAGQPYKGRHGRVEGTRELVIHPSSSALWIAGIFSSLCGSRIRRVGAALRYTIPADGNQRRTVPAFNWQPVISLIFIASSSVLQRERW